MLIPTKSFPKRSSIHQNQPGRKQNLPLLIGVAGDFMRCVRDSNPWPHAWQACILTNWTNAPFAFWGVMFVRSIRCSSFAIAKEAHFSELTKPKRVFFHFPAHFSSKSPRFRRNSNGFRRKRTCFLSSFPCFSTKSKEMKYLCRCIFYYRAMLTQ